MTNLEDEEITFVGIFLLGILDLSNPLFACTFDCNDFVCWLFAEGF